MACLQKQEASLPFRSLGEEGSRKQDLKGGFYISKYKLSQKRKLLEKRRYYLEAMPGAVSKRYAHQTAKENNNGKENK